MIDGVYTVNRTIADLRFTEITDLKVDASTQMCDIVERAGYKVVDNTDREALIDETFGHM